MLADRPAALPKIPPAARYAIAGGVIAMLVYGMAMMENDPAPLDPPPEPPPVVSVPQLDAAILAGARDDTREHRLRLEPEPLRHLLAKAIDVGPTVAEALGMPDAPVPIAELRADPGRWRNQWLWYEGELTQLSGAREGHPIAGYTIHEATVRLASGEHVLVAFSLPPEPDLAVGMWVRVEGWFLKFRDATYPQPIDSAPMLVGRRIQRDYADWGSVTQLDSELLATVSDGDYFPGAVAMRDVVEDQTEALWHLAAFVRDTANTRTLADWRRIPLLHGEQWHKQVMDGTIPRGTPLRVFGVLIRRQTLAAPANPAGIKAWTVAWIQVREYGGKLVPIWVPKRVADLPRRAPLEVRAFYYRRCAYDTEEGDRRVTPLFVAADLDLYLLETDRTMRWIGLWLAGIACVFVVLLFWAQRRTARSSVEHSRAMDVRRRHRRERAAAQQPAPAAPPVPPNPPVPPIPPIPPPLP